MASKKIITTRRKLITGAAALAAVSTLPRDGEAATIITRGAMSAEAFGFGNAGSAAGGGPGKLMVWGYNAFQRWGDPALGFGAKVCSPIQIGAATNWNNITLPGSFGQVSFKLNGQGYACGYNQTGQLGVAGLSSTTSFVAITGARSGWSYPNCFGTTTWGVYNGKLYVWGGVSGYSRYANKFTNTLQSNNISSPTQLGTQTNWKMASLGGGMGAGVTTNGKLYVWGDNGHYYGIRNYGALGTNNRTSYSVPKQIGIGSTWTWVAVVYRATFAINSLGQLFSWGYNRQGVLGQNISTSITVCSPVQVGTASNWVKVGGANNSSPASAWAINASGNLFTWGQNSNGSLGLGDTVSRSTPTQVGSLSGWTNAAIGGANPNSLFIRGGKLYACGDNSRGQLGLGTNTPSVVYSSPVQVGSLSTWQSAAIAPNSYCSAGILK